MKEKCVGGFVGHFQGITCVSTPNDFGSSKYVLSNSKDQKMKLWDLRVMNTLTELDDTRAGLEDSTAQFDYRYRGYSAQRSRTAQKKIRIDRSLNTFEGHQVSRTLCRSGFSPVHSTSAKYVYCGSSDYGIYIYETLTGKLHRRLEGHADIVRDVCWHPYLPLIVSASWDRSVRRWAHVDSHRDVEKERRKRKRKGNDAMNDEEDDSEDQGHGDKGMEDWESTENVKIPRTVSLDLPNPQHRR